MDANLRGQMQPGIPHCSHCALPFRTKLSRSCQECLDLWRCVSKASNIFFLSLMRTVPGLPHIQGKCPCHSYECQRKLLRAGWQPIREAKRFYIGIVAICNGNKYELWSCDVEMGMKFVTSMANLFMAVALRD